MSGREGQRLYASSGANTDAWAMQHGWSATQVTEYISCFGQRRGSAACKCWNLLENAPYQLRLLRQQLTEQNTLPTYS